jgi:hypothetical protein
VRIIIECPENILHLEAGYIYADCLFDSSSNLLQSGGGPYISSIDQGAPRAAGAMTKTVMCHRFHMP